MPAGLQVFDRFGNLKVGIGDRLLRFLGPPLIVSEGTSGTLVNDGFLTGTPFYVANPFNPSGTSYFPGDSSYPPAISIVGNVLSYTINLGQATQIIQYGVH